MQLKISTNFAIRIILELAKRQKLTCKEIAEQLNIGESYTTGILNKLIKADIINVVQGINGGYVLKANLAKLTLLDVIKVMETTVKINRCLEEDEFCSRGAVKTCKLRQQYEKLQVQIENELSRLTFQEMLSCVEREE